MKNVIFISSIFCLLAITSCGVRSEPTESEAKTRLESQDELDVESVNKEKNDVFYRESGEIIASTEDISDRNEKILYDIIKEMYRCGEWDGTPMILQEHEISLSGHGDILLDGYWLGPQENVDLPNFFKGNVDSCNLKYIPGQGTYILLDESYEKYVRGEKISLKGGPLKWKKGEGIDKDYGHAILQYDEIHDTMFLTTPMIYDWFDEENNYDYTYLYIFPDYNVSEIELIGKVKYVRNDEDGFCYIDMDGSIWRYLGKNSVGYQMWEHELKNGF